MLILERKLPSKYFQHSKDLLHKKKWNIIKEKMLEIKNLLEKDNQIIPVKEILEMNDHSMKLVDSLSERQNYEQDCPY